MRSKNRMIGRKDRFLAALGMTDGLFGMSGGLFGMKRLLGMAELLRITGLLLISALFFSCGESSGLGSEVDVTAPKISLTSHSDDDTVPSVFTLSGTAWDDDGVALITVDFDDADLHYKVTPGSSWLKKTGSSDWQEVSADYGSCKLSDKTWSWSIFVDTTEKSALKTDTTFVFSAIASDKMGNSDRNSKVDCSLTVDKENPDVSLNFPAIFSGTYENALETAGTYNLKDGNVISRLLNGDLTFTGRQENSISFKELRIEFDDGGLSTNARKITGNAFADKNSFTADEIAENVPFDDDTKTQTYYSKTYKTGDDGIADLRNWSVTIPMSDWISDDKNAALKSGKHLIRLVSVSVSDSYAWEKKVLGYFVWWSEADIPWITTYVGDDSDKGDSAYEVYPASNLSGTAQDDDGIKSLSYVIQKKDDDGNFSKYSEGELPLSEKEVKYTAWTVKAPSENGNYSLTVTVEDINEKSDSVTKYFKTLDVSPPKIEISTPEKNSSVLLNSDGTVKFTGKISDDGTISSLYVAFLNQNPLVNTAVQNKINFMNGTVKRGEESSSSSVGAYWYEGTTSGFTDSDGNIIYKIELGTPEFSDNVNVYSFSRSFNLFEELKIDGKSKTLDTIDFIFRAEDNGGTNTVEVLTLSGDTEAPKIAIEKLVLKDNSTSSNYSYDFKDDETPSLPPITSVYTATISGTWSDNSTTIWTDDYKLKIAGLELTWNDNLIEAVLTKDGKWTAEVSNALLPTTSGLIKAKITDLGGNSKTVTRSVFVESSKAGLESIGCNNDDSSFKTGSKIEITLEFTKNTTMTVGAENPSLKLNNGKTAGYVSGNGTAKHVYEYTVEDGDDKDKLDVVEIVDNGAQWKDSSTETSISVVLPAASKRIGATRNIKIDTTKPTITSIEAISASGFYKEGSQIFLKMTFSEDVKFTNLSDDFALEFNHQNTSGYVKTGTTSLAGSKSVIFTYTVANGDNTDSLALKSVVAPSDLQASDEAGNELSLWSIPEGNSLGKTITIDTNIPSAPVVNGEWGSETIIIDTNGTRFTVSGEENASIEYSIDGGSNWISYPSAVPSAVVSLSNNGTYSVKARQTDRAGNVSSESDVQTIEVDKGDLLSLITASTFSGTYSKNTTVKQISGLIKFRSEVSIPASSTVTLNVKNSSGAFKTAAITGAGTSSNSYSFEYEIEEGDHIEDNAPLNVTGWSFESVTYKSKTIPMIFADAVTTEKSFASNREIYILTGNPQIESVDLSGVGSGAVLTVTFDRDVTKVSGNLTFTQDSTSYRIPAVVSKSEYNNIPAAAQASYSKGMNGATLNTDGTLKNDTTTKYILDYSKDIDDSTLVGYFIDANMHVVSVPIVSSAVSVAGKVLTVRLGTTYELPTKGASYTLSIPADFVTDSAQNKNAGYSATLTAGGIESPMIRINKESQKITIGTASNPTTTATVNTPSTASVKIDCRTPEATIYYAKTSDTAAVSSVSTVQYEPISISETSKPKVSALTSYSSTTDVSVTTTLGTAINGYDSATGMKYAIAAYAEKDSVESEKSYEYATRTVLKLYVKPDYYAGSCPVGYASDVTENGSTLTYDQLKIWIQGGDATSGGNSLDPFPLSWGTCTNFKLMIQASGNHTNGKYYWVTWDLNATAYHGFVLGNVHNYGEDGIGPSVWYATDRGWTKFKSLYPLYPGETMEMITCEYGGNVFQFNSALKCTN